MISYHEFLKRKRDTEPPDGIDVPEGTLHPRLFDWQKRIVSWALKVGRAAIWADTGLGKTMMQLEWARRFDGRRLVVAPLAVCEQTCREARKLDLTATYVRTPDEITGDGVWVTNYERVESFPADMFNAVVLDEASILKQSTGKTRTMLINHFKPVRHRLACTATPAPNDPEELTSQAEFLGHSTRQEILATYFTNNLGADKGSGWRLKGHGRTAFMRWLAQWAIALRKPSDIGGSDAGFELPGLHVDADYVPYRGFVPDGQLFAYDIGGVGGRSRVRRETLDARVAKSVELVNRHPDDQWIIWCGLNDEADRLEKLIPGAVNVKGSMSAEDKARAFLDFADGNIRVLVTKAQMAAFGLNWQNCHRMIFCGINDSWESYYQSIRRCYRFGQRHVVDVHIVCSDLESEIAANIQRKEHEATMLSADLVATMNETRNYRKAA